MVLLQANVQAVLFTCRMYPRLDMVDRPGMKGPKLQDVSRGFENLSWHQVHSWSPIFSHYLGAAATAC